MHVFGEELGLGAAVHDGTLTIWRIAQGREVPVQGKLPHPRRGNV